ncbi:MAG: type VI secretion system-associated protein TagF [Kangiellaceae bacterium]|nr:type VI secretion system-associated protein TagF [Kangiellaceae bacterium]
MFVPMTGVYGKLPLHGDFIYRNLPNDCMQTWDDWLQQFVAGSQERMGDDWLDIYLTSPVWRFGLSEGILDENAWLGIFMPSVDKVGRYFPISVLTQIPPSANLFEFMLLQKEWFVTTEELLFQALDAELDVDELMNDVNQVPLNYDVVYRKNAQVGNISSAVVNMEFEEQSPSIVFPQLLDAFLSSSLASYSVWTTPGSERVEPCMSVLQGLPKIGNVAAMIDGLWSHWQWPEPYQLNPLETD